MNQAIYLLDNMYHPDVIDKVYHKIRDTTWDHCQHIQKQMCRHKLFGGPLTDFVCDEQLNEARGFPRGSYTYFMPERLLGHRHDKYILEHFVKGKELLTLRDMLQSNMYHEQFIFHIVDYIYMNLKVQLAQNGTYLIIPIGTSDGITQQMMDEMMADYYNPYTPSRWCFEIRPKVSYVYGLGIIPEMLTEDNRIYLDLPQFTEQRMFINMGNVTEWKVATSLTTSNPNLLSQTIAEVLCDENGRDYLQLTETYANYMRSVTYVVTIFAFSEGRKAGYLITPNFLGPTGYLKTRFDEIIATVDRERLKVAEREIQEGTHIAPGADTQFGIDDHLCYTGYSLDRSWFTVPTKAGVSPIYPENFRIWEYDEENDVLRRLVSTDPELQFPNVYYYTLQSDCRMLLIEWFRDDEMLGQSYDDFTKQYRDYLGISEFYDAKMDGSLIPCLKDFVPMDQHANLDDARTRMTLLSTHDFRLYKMRQLLAETGRHWPELINAIDAENDYVNTIVYHMDRHPELWEAIQKYKGDRYWIDLQAPFHEERGFDLYIDGVHIQDTESGWYDFCQRIWFPKNMVNQDSVLIIDFYEVRKQHAKEISTYAINSTIWIPDFPVERVSGNDLVVALEDGTRISPDNIHYGISVKELLVQIPVEQINWDMLGLSQDDPSIEFRICDDPLTGKTFKAVIFRYIVDNDESYLYLKSVNTDQLVTVDGLNLMVHGGRLYVTTKNLPFTSIGRFSRRVNSADMCLILDGLDAPNMKSITVANTNVYQMATRKDLKLRPYVQFEEFYGADDPSRLLCFIDGRLAWEYEIEGQIPEKLGALFQVNFKGEYITGQRGAVVYLPFTTDRFEVTSDSTGYINLAGSGVDVLGKRDILFENGLRVPHDRIKKLTEQKYYGEANATYTIIRPHRDSNLYDFIDVEDQSIDDKMISEDVGYRTHLVNKLG